MNENPQQQSDEQQQIQIQIPKTIAEDVRSLNAAIVNMNTAIKTVAAAKQKLHDDAELWVKNNMQRATEVQQ